MNWMEQMHVGQAGKRDGSEIWTTGSAGHVMYGPYKVLVPGVYEFQVDLHVSAANGHRSDSKANLNLEVVVNESVQAERQFDLQAGAHLLRSPRVEVTDDVVQVVQVRLHSDESRALVIKSVYVIQA